MYTLLLYAIPVFMLLMALEYLYSKKRGAAWYEGADTLACLAMGVGNLLIGLITGGLVFGLYMLCYEMRFYTFAPTALISWVVLFFAEDICYYWFHRVHHECRIGWAGHVSHHSSTFYNLAVALRQSWTTRFTGVFFWIPLAFIGFHPAMILTQQVLSLIYQYWIHTQSINRMGPLESFLNTPSHHRVHHGSNPQYIDRNYGGFLIIWDRLFGSFEPEEEPVVYGLTKNINTYNPIKIAFHEWLSMFKDAAKVTSWRHKLCCFFKHPSWFAQKYSD